MKRNASNVPGAVNLLMVVDASEFEAKETEAMLKAGGVVVGELLRCDSLHQAVCELGLRRVDVVVIDPELSDGCRREAVRAVRSLCDGVVIVLANGGVEDRLDCLRMGADDYLSKSTRTAELLRLSIANSIEKAQADRLVRRIHDNLIKLEKMVPGA